jgi:hypothetical protein
MQQFVPTKVLLLLDVIDMELGTGFVCDILLFQVSEQYDINHIH